MSGFSGPPFLVGANYTVTGNWIFNKNSAAAPANAGGSVVQLVGADSNVARFEADGFGQIAAFTARRANGTLASPTALASGDQIGAFNYHGYYVTGGPAYSGVQASVQGMATQNWTSTALGTKVVISTTPNGSTTLTPVATFDQDGSAALGATVISIAPAANTSIDGLTLTDPTAATAGNQQFSPRIRLTGQGWKTASTAGSQTVDFIIENQPVQGSANPTPSLIISSQKNGLGYVKQAAFLANAVNYTLAVQNGFIAGSTTTSGPIDIFAFYSGIGLGANIPIGWTSQANLGSGSVDTRILRSGSAGSFLFDNTSTGFILTATASNGVLQLGAADAASPVAQTLKAQGSRAGTDSNVAGPNFTVAAPNGTGNSTPAKLLLNSPVAVASGTGAQTSTTGLAINVGTAVLTSYTVANLPAAATAGAGATAFVTDGSTTFILGLGLTVAGGGANKVPVYSDGTNWIVG